MLLATYAPPSPGSTPVGMSSPSAKTVVLSALPVALGVFEDDDLVVGLLAGLDLRVNLARRHPEPALRVEVHLDRLGQQRVGREQVHLEPRRDDERLALQFRVGVGHRGVGLAEGGGGGEGEKQGEKKVAHVWGVWLDWLVSWVDGARLARGFARGLAPLLATGLRPFRTPGF